MIYLLHSRRCLRMSSGDPCLVHVFLSDAMPALLTRIQRHFSFDSNSCRIFLEMNVFHQSMTAFKRKINKANDLHHAFFRSDISLQGNYVAASVFSVQFGDFL
jgi:hypothetical protein